MQDGRFLVRPRPGTPAEYVLSVVFKGKATHHLIQPAPDGVLQINRKTLGAFRTLDALVAGLRNPDSLPQGWPVPLAFPVAPAGAPAAAPSAPSAAPAAAAAPATASEPQYATVKKPGRPWFHGDLSREDADGE